MRSGSVLAKVGLRVRFGSVATQGRFSNQMAKIKVFGKTLVL